MNQLKRIILVNSGNVDFQEVRLDGNIHFIGTQGTGKSTILRAILFFYNADSRKLGIAKEKKPFAEYYFPFADSYILYEISRGSQSFCAWLYKKQTRLCFRFIDGPYHPDLIISNRQALPESEVVIKAAEKGYKVSRPIYNFTEYRDIIYGADKGMRRYSLMQNQSYHNIPRTISNIFLNSSLDGDFIKKTIINSLSDEAFEINLDKNRYHLETARQNYQDLSEYIKHEKKAQNIVNLYALLIKQEEEQKVLAWEIG
ncbi:MAG: ATP-binding protein, partial [Breznakibacter sp.]|nr:ATP-binding protein [Breznakibacter sp.]